MHAKLLFTALLCALLFALGSAVLKDQENVCNTFRKHLEGQESSVPLDELFESKPEITFRKDDQTMPMEWSDFSDRTKQHHFKPRPEAEEIKGLKEANVLARDPDDDSYMYFWQWQNTIDGKSSHGFAKGTMLKDKLLFSKVQIFDLTSDTSGSFKEAP